MTTETKPSNRPLTIFGLAVLLLAAPAALPAQPQSTFLPEKDEHSHVEAANLSAAEYERARRLASLLMAPCCYAKTAAEDQSGAAHQVKDQVRVGISQGYTDEQILAGFAQVYGERILARPTAEGFNRLVWVLPFVALALGIGFALMYLRKQSGESAPETEVQQAEKSDAPSDYDKRIERELGEFGS